MQSGRSVGRRRHRILFRFVFPLALALLVHALLCQVLHDSFKTVIIITLSYPAHARADKQKYSSLFFIMFDK